MKTRFKRFNADDGTIATDTTPVTPTAPLTPPNPPAQAEPAPSTDEDTAALKKALKAERDRAKQFEQQLTTLQKTFENIDPQKYKELQAAQQAALAEAEKAQQAIAAARAEVEADYTAKLQKEQQKIAQEQAKVNQLQSTLQNLVKRNNAEKAFALANGRNGGGEDGITFFDTFYQAVSGLLQLDENNNLFVAGPDGKPLQKDNKPLSVKEYFESLSSHPVYGHYFEPRNDNKGTGMPPNGAQRAPNGKVDFSQIKDPVARLEAVRSAKAQGLVV